MDIGRLRLSGKHTRSRPQHKIIILRAVIAGTLLQASEHIRSQHQEMADIVVGKQEIQVEIRLPVRLIKNLSTAVTFILVRIEKHRGDSLLFAFLQCTGHFIQSVRRQKIVMVQKAGVGSANRLQRFIGISRNSKVFSKLQITDAHILPLLHHLSHRVRASGVRNHQLPVDPALPLHAVKEGAEEIRRRFICRHNHGKKGRILKGFRFPFLTQKFLLRRRLITVAFLLFFQQNPLRHSPGSGRYAVSSEITESTFPSRSEPFYHLYLHAEVSPGPRGEVTQMIFPRNHRPLKRPAPGCIRRERHPQKAAPPVWKRPDTPAIPHRQRSLLQMPPSSLLVSYSITAFSSSVSFSFFSCASSRLVPFTPI